MYDEFEKYALYWVPKRDDALARFGASWTGWCAEQGEPRARDTLRSFSFDIPAITRQLRGHGLHAVFKAPFRLGQGRSRFSLEHILAQVVENCVSFPLPRLRLAVVDGSVALVPDQNCTALGDLVARIGAAMAPLEVAGPTNGFAEAPAMTPAAAPRGISACNSETVIQLPIVAARRFQMPLTDQLDAAMAFNVKEALEPVLEQILDQPRHLQDVALMGDPGEGRPLRVLQRYELRDTPLRQASSALPCQGPHVLVSMFSGPIAKTDIAI